MVTITKNGKTKTVSTPAYKSIFKDAGWKVVGEQSSTPSVIEEKVEETKQEDVDVETVVEENKEDVDDDNDDEVPDEVWDEVQAEEEVEKPLSEMNREEMLAKAKELKVAVTKNMTNKELREAIKAKM